MNFLLGTCFNETKEFAAVGINDILKSKEEH
jgi:hypothetical protein